MKKSMYQFENSYLEIYKFYNIKEEKIYLLQELIDEDKSDYLELHFDVFFKEENIFVFSISNLFNDTSIYINKQEYNVRGVWFERIVFKSHSGINNFNIIILNPSLSKNFKVEIYSYNFHKLYFNNFNILDDYNDVKKYKIKELNYDNHVLNICVISNTALISKKVKVTIFLEKINKNELVIERKKIVDIIICIDKNEAIDLSSYMIPNDTIIQIGILENEQLELFYDEKYILPSNIYEQIDKIKADVISLYLKVIKEKKWAFKYFQFNLDGIFEFENCFYKYYAIKKHINILNVVINSQNEFELNNKYNDYFAIKLTSKIDGQRYIYYLYKSHVENCKTIIVLSHLDDSEFGKLYSVLRKNNLHVNMLCIPLRGVLFGNYISEQTFFEAIKDANKIIKISNAIICGYSSNASAAINLGVHYPHMFNKVISFAGRFNEELIENINNKLISLIGYDDDIINYKINEYKLEHINHISIFPWLFNINFWKCILQDNTIYNSNLYATNKLFYSKFKCFEILELINKVGTIKIIKKNIFEFENIKKICIKSTINKDIIVNGKTISIEKGKNFIKITKYNIKKISKEIINKPIEILDIYCYPIKIYINDNSSLTFANVLSSPKTLGFNPNINIHFKIILKKRIPKIGKNNLIMINYKNDDDLFKYYEKSFVFKNRLFTGDYAIFNIYSQNNTYILNINYSSKRYFDSIILSRVIYIPASFHKNKSILNNKYIIFYKNKKIISG